MTSALPPRSGGYLDRPHSSSLADVLTVVLDKGLVIDAYVSLSVVGIQLLSVDARIVVASVDTYLRFAEATNRLNLEATGGTSLVDVFEEGFEHAVEHVAHDVAKEKTEHVIEPVKEAFAAVKETVKEIFVGDDEEQTEEEAEEQAEEDAEKDAEKDAAKDAAKDDNNHE